MRYLHTMIRVGNLERSISFYTTVLGLKLHRSKDYPDGKFTLAFLGTGGESEPFYERFLMDKLNLKKIKEQG